MLKYFSPSEWATLPHQEFLQVKDSSKADFFLLTGGEDISPSIYGQNIFGASGVNRNRDTEELALIGFAKAWSVPIVGICRGMQLLHASNGGSLIQDLPGHRGNHKMISMDGKSEWDVNSLHHQGVPIEEAVSMYGHENVYVNDDWVSAEAIFCPKRLTYGVQYHPEFGGCPETGYKFFFSKVKQFVKGL